MTNLLFRLITHNWSLKLAAFALAMLLWTSVRVEAPNRQTLPDVPVRVELTDPQWALVSAPLPASVEVRFAGPSRELFRMALDRPAIVIPVDQVEAGDTAIILRPQWVRIGDRPGVTVEDIQPSSVRLRFEGIERAALPVRPRLTGQLPPELALAEPIVPDPLSVQVIGAASQLEGLDSIPLSAVDLSTLTVSGPVPVWVDTTATRGLQVAPGVLSLRVVLDAATEREVPGVPILWPQGNPPEGWIWDGVAPVVRVRGAQGLVSALDPDGLSLLPQLNGMAELLDQEEGSDSLEVSLTIQGLPPLLQAEVAPVTLTRAAPDGV
ncbi:MAG: YbbR-like domain-containing protein [Gemmatimonadota bacterium]